MALLARREHSVEELKRKLSSRGFDPETVARAVAALKNEGLQSDRRFAESFIYQRMETGSGPLRIRAQLQQRGVSEELVEACLNATDADWFSRLLHVREKKFGKSLPRDYQEQARQSRFLQYRGFSAEQIRRLFKSDE